jgi:hypothetical protein
MPENNERHADIINRLSAYFCEPEWAQGFPKVTSELLVALNHYFAVHGITVSMIRVNASLCKWFKDVPRMVYNMRILRDGASEEFEWDVGEAPYIAWLIARKPVIECLLMAFIYDNNKRLHTFCSAIPEDADDFENGSRDSLWEGVDYEAFVRSIGYQYKIPAPLI